MQAYIVKRHLMHVCGAPNQPFSEFPWETHPYAVLERFFSRLL